MLREFFSKSRSKLVILLSVCAALVGFLNIAPQLLIWRSLEAQSRPYLPINYLAANDEVKIYAARAREVYDGHFPPSEVSAGQQGITPLNHLPSLLFGSVLKLFFGNVAMAYLAAQFVFSIVIFLLFYFIIRLITGDRVWAVFSGFAAGLMPMVPYLSRAFTNLGDFLNLVIKSFIPVVKTPIASSFINRIDDPLLTVSVYMAALLALTWFWLSPSRKSAILSGLSVGLLFYTYIHYWIFTVVALGLLSACVLFHRFIPKRFSIDPGQLPLKKDIFVLLATLSLSVVPYFVNYFLFRGSALAEDFMLRGAFIEYGRYFRISGVWPDYLLYIAMAGAAIAAFWKENRKSALFFLALTGAMFVVWNIQLVSGYTFVSSHWRQAFNPAAFVMIVAIVHKLVGRLNKKKVYGVLALLILLLVVKRLVNAGNFIRPTEEVLARHSGIGAVEESWKWIDSNLREPRLATPSFMTSFDMTVYSSARPFLLYWPHTLASMKEVEDRFLIANKIFNVSPEVFEKRLLFYYEGSDCEEILREFGGPAQKCNPYTLYNIGDAGAHLYGAYFLQKTFSNANPGWTDNWIATEKIKELASRYSRSDWSWKDLPADYVYYGPWEKELGLPKFSSDHGLRSVYKNSEVEIYQIIR